MVTAQEASRVFTGEEACKAAAAPRAVVKYAVEAIGTFFRVFRVGAAAASGSPFAPLGIGAVLMVMVYAEGHFSGGHYNPAITMAVLVRRRIGLLDAVAYWIVQLGCRAACGGGRAYRHRSGADRYDCDDDADWPHASRRVRGGAVVHLRPVLRGAQRSHQQESPG